MRKKLWRVSCPYCGGIFFTLHSVSLGLRRNKMPQITGLTCDFTCEGCGLETDYVDFIRQFRGWLVPRRKAKNVR